MDDVKQEFWGDLQVDLYTANSAIYLANQSLENLISVNGRKAHRPILSHSQIGTYNPGSDISFASKTASKNTLEVDTFEYAAEEIDITDKMQTPYDLMQHSLKSIRQGLMNAFEQKYLSEITNSFHSINGGTAFELLPSNFMDVLQEADSKLGAFDVPTESSMRAAVLGPNAVAILRRAKAERETGIGDSVLANGVIGPYHGWTIVQNNNLPWSATLTIATKPTDGDTVVISGVTFTFKTTLGTTAGQVLIGDDAASARANLKLAVEGGAGAGTNYIEIGIMNNFILRRKRNVHCSSAEAMAFTGYGDIAVSETLTAAADIWSAQQQLASFMIRGAIDAVMQFMDIKVGDKEKGFADLPKGIIGMGTEMFPDGQIASVKMVLDASNFK
ncbi:MAG: hypothetical protein PHO75_02435 [Candidatus Shapirobacteria bacterium]|nr:hypothetical protein [Candidatus Shapirobacteria bacterium]